MKRARIRLGTALGWATAALLVGYVAFTADVQGFFDSVSSASLGLFLLGALIAGPLAFALDTAGIWKLLRAAGVPLAAGEAARLRGASYLLNVVNYELALAAIAGLLARRTGRGLAEAAGCSLALAVFDLSGVALAALIGLLFGAPPLPEGLAGWATAAAALGVAGGPALILVARRLRPRLRSGGALAGLLAALALLSRRDALLTWALRVALVLLYVLGDWIFLTSFGFDVPADVALSYLPALYFVIILPVSVGGLGGGQLATRWLFGPWAPPGVTPTAAADAFSTCSFLAVLAFRVVVGLACLPWALRAARDPGAAAPAVTTAA
jgi:hypothetical protein